MVLNTINIVVRCENKPSELENIVIEVFFLPPSSPIQPPVIVQADIERVIIAICWILTPHWQRDIKKQNDYQLGLHFYFAPCTWTNTVETNRPFVQIRRALITVFCRLWMKSGIWRCWCILTVLLNIKWALWGQWATLFFERLLKLTSTQHKPSNFEIKRISLSSLHWKYPPEKPALKSCWVSSSCPHWTKTHWSWKAVKALLPAPAVLLSHTLLWGSSRIINVQHLNAPRSTHRSCTERLPLRHSWRAGAGLDNRNITSTQLHHLTHFTCTDDAITSSWWKICPHHK